MAYEVIGKSVVGIIRLKALKMWKPPKPVDESRGGRLSTTYALKVIKVMKSQNSSPFPESVLKESIVLYANGTFEQVRGSPIKEKNPS